MAHSRLIEQCGIKLNHFLQRLESSVVHIGCRASNVSQGRGLEFTQIAIPCRDIMKRLIGLERRVITEVSLAVKGVVFDLLHGWIPPLIQRRAATIQANIVKLMIGKGRSGMAKGALALADKKQQSTQGLLVEFG